MKNILKIAYLTIISVIFISSKGNSKQIAILFQWNGNTIELNKYYKINNSDSIQFETIKTYISNIELTTENNKKVKLPKKHFLIDLSKNNNNLTIPINQNYKSITFTLGVDSSTNASGVHGQDLDPMHGMYWSWQSGYINLKIEGKCSLIASKDKELTYHIGGFAAPYNTSKTITLPFSKNSKSIILPLNKIITSDYIPKNNHIMSPGETAQNFSILTAKNIYISNE